MATETIQYQTSGGTYRTEFGSDTNLNSLANNSACAIGAVNNVTNAACGYYIDLTLVCSAAPTANTTFTVYLIGAPNTGTTGSPTAGTYTDGISATGTGVTIITATVVRTLAVNTTSPYTTYARFRLPEIDPPPYWSLVVLNGSGVALASTGNSAYWTPITYPVG